MGKEKFLYSLISAFPTLINFTISLLLLNDSLNIIPSFYKSSLFLQFGGVDWGGGIVHYFTSFNQYFARHLLFAGSDSLNTSELYVSGVLTTTGTCSTTMTSWGANSRLFSDGQGNNKMPVGGGCAAFRVWNTRVDATQAEILYLHSKGKYIWDASM